ncbi:MAG: response regulator transcription factor [Gammaproteobacteria bacterium]|jgi:DNA-binding response OmpR family regulator|nr:response regulator transcription factor [Gammaproteobacteria bacterium]
MRILIIEDNPDIAANLGDYLEDRKHIVDFAADGKTGLQLALSHDFEAIVLDLFLPGLDGFEVCEQIRAQASRHIPILMLTARDQLEDKLEGFRRGADDYLVKPFELQEVEARLEVITRRVDPSLQTRKLQIGDLHYDLDTMMVDRAGVNIDLNPIGLKILRCLMRASPRVVTRAEIEADVWGDELPDSDSLRVHIHGLRSTIDKPFDKPMIQTRHGIGYRIIAPD